MSREIRWITGSILILTFAGGCNSGGAGEDARDLTATAESCMSCHNGSNHDDYGAAGLENPHPFPGAATLTCTQCHGGDGNASSMTMAHVPPPPEIGDENFQRTNAEAYFNRLTLAGIDKYDDYDFAGQTYTALDYLQFINPGDLRVVTTGKSCGACHQNHAECVAKSPLATESGILSGALFAIGVNNKVAASQGIYEKTAADVGFRALTDFDFTFLASVIGPVSELREFPVFSVRGGEGVLDVFNNAAYDSVNLPSGQLADGRAVSESPLANLFHEQVAFTCGDCHLGSAGANNRYGDFRSSGCTACHMRYSLDGRSRSSDPNIKKFEPVDPDDIDEPERAHVRRHLITSRARTLTTGESVAGIDDYTCAGCHQGSNRTVMQYWGIRLDQNQDVRRGNQYPAQPASFRTTFADTRLFDPSSANHTFNGRNHGQYLLEEDYDGDGRDDTPPDVHYEAGLGCIDCHGSHDMHGGNISDPSSSRIMSRMEQAVSIRCENCHGTNDAYATTTTGIDYDGNTATMAVDANGNALKNVKLEGGEYYLYSRLTGNRHYIKQTRDVIVDSGKTHPFTGEAIYNPRASYAMGRVDGSSTTGTGPQQTGGVTTNFCHSDTMSCVACHSSWTNTCMGCHLSGDYNNGNNFSNITGERIVFKQDDADFVYQSPVFFQLGVNSHGEIGPSSPNTEVFFHWTDRNNVDSQIFAFSDRNSRGNNTGVATHPALGHNVMMPHSIRGRVDANNEGPRYCVACHLTDNSIASYGTEYDDFRNAMATDDFAALDFDLLATHIGENTGNQMDSPIWVHMVAGLGTGLFMFDENGCPVNPLDDNDQRIGCDDVAPSTIFDPARVVYNLDRIVDEFGLALGSSNHALLSASSSPLRDGASDDKLAGPLGATLIERLSNPSTGIVLDSWLDANSDEQGDASTHIDY